MSVKAYTGAEIVARYARVLPMRYAYAAGITIIVYDSLILLGRELEYIYKGPHLIRWIYLLVKVTGLVILVLNFAAYITTPTPALWVLTLSIKKSRRLKYNLGAFYGSGLLDLIKILLVLRLRALYQNDKLVTIVLWFATVAELLSVALVHVMSFLKLYQSINSESSASVPGFSEPASEYHIPFITLVWSTRLGSNCIELIFLLYALYRSLKKAGDHHQKTWTRVQKLAPVLYVFYRDGTFFYIPLCAISILGFAVTNKDQFACSNQWEAWLAITYYIVGTRLMLNIRIAGQRFTTSMSTAQHISTLVFQHGEQSDIEEQASIGDTFSTSTTQSTRTTEQGSGHR